MQKLKYAFAFLSFMENDEDPGLIAKIKGLEGDLRATYKSKELLFKLIKGVIKTKNWNSLEFEKIQNLEIKINEGYLYLINVGRKHRKCDAFYYITQWLFQYEDDINKEISDESNQSIKIGRWNNNGVHKFPAFIKETEIISHNEKKKNKIINWVINENKEDYYDVIVTNIKLGIEQERLLTELEFEFYYIGTASLNKYGYVTEYFSEG